MSELVAEVAAEDDVADSDVVAAVELDCSLLVAACEVDCSEETVGDAADELALCEVFAGGANCSDVAGAADVVAGAEELSLLGAADGAGEALDDGTGATEELGANTTEGAGADDGVVTGGFSAGGCTFVSVETVADGGTTLGSEAGGAGGAGGATGGAGATTDS